MIHEEIKPIPGFPDYFASKSGNIYSLKHYKNSQHPTNPKLLKPSLAGQVRPYRRSMQYRYVTLSVKGKRVSRKIASLVLTTFLGPRPKGKYGLHGPKGRLDDSLDNLSWGTMSKNIGEDRRRDGTSICGEKTNTAKLSEKKVREIRSMATRETKARLAAIYNVSERQIYRIQRHENWKHIK